MRLRPPARHLALAVLLLGAPRTAAAVCTAQDIIAADPSCGASGPCTIARTHTVENGCTLDFGARALTLTGRLLVGSRSATLRAGSLSISGSGFIDANGGSPGARGGTFIVETAAFFVTQLGSRFEADGTVAGGAILVRAGTFIAIGGRVLAENRGETASGGLIDLRAGGDINLASTSAVRARGGADSDGGGEIDLTAGGNILVRTGLDVSALDGGFVELRADGTATIGDADASGGGDAGSGGCIDVFGRAGALIEGALVADGATGTFMTGGCGGLICLDGNAATLTIASGASVSANGASPDGGGGQISLLSRVAAVVNGTVEARGPIGETCGGDVCIETGRDVTINGGALLDVSGGDAGGTMELIAGRDITINGDLDLRGRQRGAFGGVLAVHAGNAGTGQLRIANTVDLSSAPTCSPELGCGEGGSSELSGCDVTITNAAALLATGPAGGTQRVTAREQMRLQGIIDATRTQAGTDNGLTVLQYPERKTPILTGPVAPTPVRTVLSTCPTQGPTMPSCLSPCPACGDGQVEYPETCDEGMVPPQSCGGCSRFCQVEDCDDRLVCTGDSCLPDAGCLHRVTPECTEPPTPTPTITGTRPTATNTPTASATPSATDTASVTATASATRTGTASATATATGSPTPSPSATASITATAVHTPTPPDTATATATVTPAACAGDCNRDGSVTVNELITGVNIALGNTTVASCPPFDRNGDGEVSINELIAAVNAALAGC